MSTTILDMDVQQETPSTVETVDGQTTPTRKSRLKIAAVVIAVIATIAVSAIILLAVTGPAAVQHASDVAMQAADVSSYVEIMDDGETLVIDGPSKYSSNMYAVDTYTQTVLAELNAPDYVWEQMMHTSSNDGRQTATWDDYSASWKYHPDNGLDVIITTD